MSGCHFTLLTGRIYSCQRQLPGVFTTLNVVFLRLSFLKCIDVLRTRFREESLTFLDVAVAPSGDFCHWFCYIEVFKYLLLMCHNSL